MPCAGSLVSQWPLRTAPCDDHASLEAHAAAVHQPETPTVCVHVCVHICITCVYMYISILHVYTCVHVHLYYMRVCICVCVYTIVLYVHVCVHIHVYTAMYTCVLHVCRGIVLQILTSSPCSHESIHVLYISMYN